MVELFGMARTNERYFVDDGRQVRQHLGNNCAGLPVLFVCGAAGVYGAKFLAAIEDYGNQFLAFKFGVRPPPAEPSNEPPPQKVIVVAEETENHEKDK